MRPNGRVRAAAALAVSLCCGGSLPPPATQPAAGGPPTQSPAAAVGGVAERQPAATGAIAGRVVSAADRRPLSRATSRRLRLLRTDANGRFQVRELPAGEYRAVATCALDESETDRRDLLRRLARDGVPLSIGDRQRRAVDLPLVSLPAARRAVSR
jgi:hypothetical protein